MLVPTKTRLSLSFLTRVQQSTWYLTLQAVQIQPRCACMQGEFRSNSCIFVKQRSTGCPCTCTAALQPNFPWMEGSMLVHMTTLPQVKCLQYCSSPSLLYGVQLCTSAAQCSMRDIMQVRGKTVYLQYSTRQEIVHSKQPLDGPSNVLLVTMDNLDVRSFP